jgi:hypothetical protein
MDFKYNNNKQSTIVLGWTNTAKEFLSNWIAEKYWLEKSDVIHGDRLRRELFDRLSDKDQKIHFPKIYKFLKLWEKGVDIINKSWIDAYLADEFKESEFIYETMLQPIIENLWENDKKVIVWVQILPELLAKDIPWKEKFLWIITALRTNPKLLKDREFDYRKINHNHDTYVYSYLQQKIDLNKLTQKDQNKLKELSENLNLPISAYLLLLLAKVEYNKAIENKLKESWLFNNSTIIDTSIDFERKINDILF